MNIDYEALFKQSLLTFLTTLKDTGVEIMPELEQSVGETITLLIKNLREIVQLLHNKQIGVAEADTLMDLQRDAWQGQLLLLRGVSEVILQKSMNVTWDFIKTAIGVVLKGVAFS